LLLKNDEVGVRELQKVLGFKSPSTAKHHLDRLVELGLAEKTLNGYKAIASSSVLKRSNQFS
jgi:predicted transcriptional regulator